jgi:hypothetical protein
MVGSADAIDAKQRKEERDVESSWRKDENPEFP